MLANNFRSAQDLSLSEDERSALISVLGSLEREEFMDFDLSDCNHCICGQARRMGGLSLFSDFTANPSLFTKIRMPIFYGACDNPTSQANAALRLRSFLTGYQ